MKIDWQLTNHVIYFHDLLSFKWVCWKSLVVTELYLSVLVNEREAFGETPVYKRYKLRRKDLTLIK